MEGYEKEEKKGLSTMVIVLIVVGALVVLAVVGVLIMGFTFLWASSFTSDNGSEVTHLNLRASIDGTTDTLELEVISGNVNWYEYRVEVDGQELTTLSSTSGPEDAPIFTGMMWDPVSGNPYEINVFEADGGSLRWSDTVTAT
ncbi:MAG: hypothetical protein JW939_08355 [Candidatus Thermoplasmatota archaeon]|nr:hypothetical protein [Candidatus Thermoplasmatota archaeon]